MSKRKSRGSWLTHVSSNDDLPPFAILLEKDIMVQEEKVVARLTKIDKVRKKIAKYLNL